MIFINPANTSSIIYSPRDGVNYTINYTVKSGMIYPEAQGHKGTPVQIGGLPERIAAREAAISMVAKFHLLSDEQLFSEIDQLLDESHSDSN